MQRIRTESWFSTPEGEPRGYIETTALRELWFHTGTACNLSCPFCFEGSKPGDDRLGLMLLDDVIPLIDEACELGVEQFSFTGGEPFVAKQFPRILAYASARKPCLILTNGTRPLLQRMDEVRPLVDAAHPLSFRISIDYADVAQHEAGRGQGTFAESMQALRLLQEAGFHVSVARQWSPEEDSEAVTKAYQALFVENGITADTRLVSFPDFDLPGVERATPQITEDCMTRYHDAPSRAAFMCAFSRMVVKDKGRMRVYACTLVDDDPSYDLGATLRDSLSEKIRLKHHRCFTCFKHGSSCSEL